MTEKEQKEYENLVRSQLYLSLDIGIRLATLLDILKYNAALEENTMTEEIRIRHDYALEIIKICDDMSDREERMLGKQ